MTGSNVYMPDGMYTVTVSINGETAQFPAVLVSGGDSPGIPTPPIPMSSQ